MTTRTKALSNGDIVDTSTGEVLDVTLVEAGLADPIAVNETSDKAIVISAFREVVASVMSEAQFAILSGRTPRNVIKKRPGKGGKTFSYIPHGYVTSALNKAFGFHWSFETLPNGKGDRFQFIEGQEVTSNGKIVRTPSSMLVTGRLTVYVHDPANMSNVIAVIAKDSTGEKEFVPGMTWGAMVKSAESDAFKRCAARLGIGSDLYWEEPDVLEDVPPDALTVRAREMKAQGASVSAIAKELGIPIPEAARRLR
jgi:hypothetical protein